MSIGERLIQLREEQDIYQKEIATHLNVTVGTISNYENGIHSPDLTTLKKLARFYGVTTDYLLGETSFRQNISYLNGDYVDNYSIASFITAALELSPSNRRTLLEQLELLKLRNDTQQISKNKV